ncbi:ATP-binding protein [Brevibacillus sp. SYSU BS000544]|uniref:ATP-binding protein n=1 Tax=Brevibacillus sp. SYSU BS000544 TaxID=3416443 RepID=UPI003CE5095A
MKLQYKLMLLICSLLFIVIVAIGAISQIMQARALKEQIGLRALNVAVTVASIPEIKNAFSQREPWTVIQPIAEKVRLRTGAEFVVVGNREGIRYSHPIFERIGKEMVGGDNHPVLAGQSIISEAEGSMGRSLRGKAPILDDDGNVIGIVSVGFLIRNIENEAIYSLHRLILFGTAMLVLGISGAILIAYNVKRSIFGLEPTEISRLYQEKFAILESIREGIIAVNTKGTITLANQTAVKLLGLAEGTDITGKSIADFIPTSRMLEVTQSGKAEFDQELVLGDNVVVVNRLPIYDHKSRIIGAVSSFRSKSELYRLTEEVTQVRKYAEALRAQTHEFSNKLYMISGLIQLESYQEALDVITQESNVQQNLIQFIMKEIPDPMIGGLLIGKFNRAQELKVNLIIDRESSLRDVPKGLDRNAMVTIIGNLLDNAMDAVLETDHLEKVVTIFFTDLGDDLIIEVGDNGKGIREEAADKIFELGYSTKNGLDRGFGLALLKKAVSQLQGYVTFSRNTLGTGTLFTVVIPKHAGKEGDPKHAG